MGGPWSWWSWTRASWTRASWTRASWTWARPQAGADTETRSRISRGPPAFLDSPHLPLFLAPPHQYASAATPRSAGSKVAPCEGLAPPPASQVYGAQPSPPHPPPAPVRCGLGASSNHRRLFHPPPPSPPPHQQELRGGGEEQKSDSPGDILSPTLTLITAADPFFMSVFSLFRSLVLSLALFAPPTASELAPGTPGRVRNPLGNVRWVGGIPGRLTGSKQTNSVCRIDR